MDYKTLNQIGRESRHEDREIKKEALRKALMQRDPQKRQQVYNSYLGRDILRDLDEEWVYGEVF